MKIRHPYCLVMAALILLPLLSTQVNAAPQGYSVVNAVSDIDGVATRTDPDLINPWGIIAGPESVWVSLADASKLKAYQPSGKPFNYSVSVPGNPTGLAMNDGKGLIISNGNKHASATFVMATENGTIAAWAQSLPGRTASVMADRSSFGAVYKGVAIARWTNGFPRIYAANFHVGVIDVYDSKFQFIGSFNDSSAPGGYAPFNVQLIRGYLFVTYAKQAAPDFTEEEPGAGNGFIDIFDRDGTFLRRFATGGPLNAPWGMAIAPRNFGEFSNALLVGNFGDGRINAFDLLTGKHLGFLKTGAGEAIEIDGLWGLDFDQRENAEDLCGFNASRLYFSAGIEDETHGLLGYIRVTQPPQQGPQFPFPTN